MVDEDVGINKHAVIIQLFSQGHIPALYLL
jgi:hypothetical protein